MVSLDIAKMLLDFGADKTLVDGKGRMALQLAEGNGHKDVAALLRRDE